MNAKTITVLEEVRRRIEDDLDLDEAGYSPAEEVKGQFQKAIGYCLKNRLLSSSETKEIAKLVADIADQKYKNWSA